MYSAKLIGRYGHIMFIASDTRKMIEKFAIEGELTIEEIRKTKLMKVSKTIDGDISW